MRLSEIKIEGHDLDEGDNFSHLYKMYNEVLVDDDLWHFFREGDYTLIRCDELSLGKLTKMLEDYGIMPGQINITDVWVDNIKATRKYQEAFTYIFHGFSVLAMQLYGAEDHGALKMSSNEALERFIGVFDRVVHCFLNMARSEKKIHGFAPFLPLRRESHLYGAWESSILLHNAIMRMYTLGTFSGKREMQGIVEKLIKEK